jgi:hypothetical protein
MSTQLTDHQKPPQSTVEEVRARHVKREPALPHYATEGLLYEVGQRELVDIVAPTSVEVTQDHIRVDGRYIRHYIITAWSRRMHGNWMARLFALKLHMQVSQHFGPFDRGLIVRQLESHQTQVESQRLSQVIGKKVEKAQFEIGSEDVRRITREVEQGVLKIFSVSMTIGVSASSLERLDSRCRALEAFLRQMQLEARSAYLLQDAAWRTCSPSGADALIRRSNKPDSGLAMDFPFASASTGTGDGAYVGHTVSGEVLGDPIFINPFSKNRTFGNGNIVVVGNTGSGKSYFTKKLGLGLLYTNTLDWVVIDQGTDYDLIAEGLGEECQVINLTQGGQINPLDLPFVPADVHARGREGDLLSEHIDNHLMSFLGLLVATKEVPLSKLEEAHLYAALVETYAQAGITSDGIRAEPRTLLRPAPLLRNLIETLKTWDKGDPYSLIERLERPSYLFKHPTGVAINRPLTVFSVKGLDETLYPLMIYTVKNFLSRNRAEMNYSRMLLFMIEEAWHMLRHPSGRKYLEESARTVRKQGIAQVTISQQPNDFLRDGETILSNAGTAVFLGMDQSAIDLLKLSPQQAQVLSAQRPGEGLIRMGNEYAHMRVIATPLEHSWFTTDPNDLQAMARVKKNLRNLR